MSTSLMFSFDVSFYESLARMAGGEAMLRQYLAEAMQDVVDLLVQAERDAMHWKHPTGRLEASMTGLVDSPYQGQAGSDLPYARRREFGFSGMTDSLGRYYAYDPGAFYMTRALADHEQDIAVRFEQAVNDWLTWLS